MLNKRQMNRLGKTGLLLPLRSQPRRKRNRKLRKPPIRPRLMLKPKSYEKPQKKLKLTGRPKR